MSGSVRYYASGAPVADSVLVIEPSGIAASSDADGRFALSTEIAEDEPQLRAEKSGGLDNGVSSLDAAFILQHLVGARDLTEAQKLACDVTGDGNLSALDAARVLDLAVGQIAHFPALSACHSDWLFVVGSLGERRALSCQQPLAVGDGESLEVEAALLGDCTGNWSGGDGGARQQLEYSPSAPRARIAPLRRRGQRAVLPIHIRTTRPYFSLDLEVRYDPAQLEPRRTRVLGRRKGGLEDTRFAADGIVRLAMANSRALNRGRRQIVFVEFDTRPGFSTGAVRVDRIRIDERPTGPLERRR